MPIIALIQNRTGGLLSNPAEQYPSVFGHIEFFREYPYALPTFVTGAIGASAAVVSALFIKEVRIRYGSHCALHSSLVCALRSSLLLTCIL